MNLEQLRKKLKSETYWLVLPSSKDKDPYCMVAVAIPWFTSVVVTPILDLDLIHYVARFEGRAEVLNMNRSRIDWTSSVTIKSTDVLRRITSNQFEFLRREVTSKDRP